MAKNCKICGDPIIKKGRTEHYGCRCVKKANKNLGNTCKTRMITACKTLSKKPSLFQKFFGITV